MKQRLVVWWVIAALLLPAAVQGGGPPQVLGERQVLDNGLVWLFSEQRSLPLVSVNLLIKAGVLRDPPGKEGLANLTALMLLQGTKKRSAVQIAQEVDFLGAKLNASGSDDYAAVSLTVLKKDVVAGLELMKDVVFNPAFVPEELNRKLAQLQASFKNDEDEPGIIASRAFHRRLFGKNPYAYPAKGTPESLKAIKREDLLAFHKKFYRPNNAILTVVGDLSRDEAQTLVAAHFGPWPAGPLPPLEAPAPPPLNKAEVVLIDKPITQANIVWGQLSLARDHPDFYALQVLNYILGGGGFSSRLMNNIREKRGLAYFAGSSLGAGLLPGAFTISLETKNPSAGEAVRELLKEVEQIRTQPVTAEELESAKSYLIGSFPSKMDSMAKRASLLAYVELYGLGLDYPWRYPSLIRDLTPADLQRVASKYFHPDNFVLVIVGKKEEVGKLPVAPAAGTRGE